MNVRGDGTEHMPNHRAAGLSSRPRDAAMVAYPGSIRALDFLVRVARYGAVASGGAVSRWASGPGRTCPTMSRSGRDGGLPHSGLVRDPVVPPLPCRLVAGAADPSHMVPAVAVPGREGLSVGCRGAAVVAQDRSPGLPAAGGFDRFVVGGVERDHDRGREPPGKFAGMCRRMVSCSLGASSERGLPPCPALKSLCHNELNFSAVKDA